MSILTVEERTLLKALDCRDKAQAVSALEDMLPPLPVRSEMFRTALTLSCKLKNEHIDYTFEMAGKELQDYSYEQ